MCVTKSWYQSFFDEGASVEVNTFGSFFPSIEEFSQRPADKGEPSGWLRFHIDW